MRDISLVFLLLLQGVAFPKASRIFHWDWRQSDGLSGATSLKDAKMPDSDRAALAKAIEGYIGPPDGRDPEMATEDQVKTAVLNASVKILALNEDEKAPLEVVAEIQHYCSPTGNCSMWFFRKTPQGYKLLIDSIGQDFTVEKTSTNGFRDLVVAMHSSAFEKWLKVYRYAHGRYWRAACYDWDTQVLGSDGEVHQLNEPRITPTPCGK